MMKTKAHQRGITMLEVLIALAVLSIGLAGVALMHLNSLKYVHSAYERSVASSIALDLEERLWLAIADISSVGCPDLAQGGAHFTALDSHWTETAATTQGGKQVFPVELEGLQITVVGTPTTMMTPGLLRFSLAGRDLALEPYVESPDDDSYFLIFRDRTSGDTTYGAGRFLSAEAAGPDGTTVLDFNLAYNPPCAFTPFATCPLPTPQNSLSVAVQAVERYESEEH